MQISFEIIIISIVIGALIGLSTGIGIARMFYAPEKQSLGAFRTLGEINACNGDPVSHLSFGLGFTFNAAASAAGSGALTQDVVQRIIPNWGIALASTFTKKKDITQIMKSPTLVGLGSMIVGIFLFPCLILIFNLIPLELSNIAKNVLSPAADWLIKYVMPVIFLIAALDAGKKVGTMAIIFGVLSQFISSNALPGIVLGILVGSAWNKTGLKSKQFLILLILTIILFILIAYFRGFTWQKFLDLTPIMTSFNNDFNNLGHSNLDISLFNIPGILSEI